MHRVFHVHNFFISFVIVHVDFGHFNLIFTVQNHILT